eukprot:CAMPEP_0113962458 /NCGR_PEP_ID=MMETSP0011_2-20120614/5928_1 /TAXON_ID=101924 /ORGANISM="Rhodosorus marinus" /LENGTH=276 /DNA_ID=CAMNT_0000974317 /DNA_START=127 /DNA_END=957 /DNA_ORIENTATION=- /assembly_acc=CAM_ASM_000156
MVGFVGQGLVVRDGRLRAVAQVRSRRSQTGRIARSRPVRACVEATVDDESTSIAARERNKLPLPTFMFVLPQFAINDMPSTLKMIASAIEGGVNVVQIREITDNYDMLESAVKTIVEKFPDVTVLVNSNVGVASEFQDVGIHLPEDLCKFHSIAREKTSDKKTIGSSVHSVPAAEKADENGADYLLVGTMFESESHPGKSPEGILMLKMIGRALDSSLPMIAVGGITPENVSTVIEAGASGIAVMRGISGAEDAEEAARAYKEALEHSWREMKRKA